MQAHEVLGWEHADFVAPSTQAPNNRQVKVLLQVVYYHSKRILAQTSQALGTLLKSVSPQKRLAQALSHAFAFLSSSLPK